MAKAIKKEKPLTRKDVKAKIKEHGGPKGLDLSGKVFEEGIYLSKLDLAGIILKKAQFLDYRWVHLMVNDYLGEAFLEDPNLKEAHLWGAHLEGARLSGAHLEEAFLAFAHLEKADLGRAHLEGAVLAFAHLERAFLGDAHLEGARLSGAHLEGTVLALAHLEKAFLGGAKFSADTKLDDVDWGNYILGEEKAGHYYSAEETYRRLKIWYREHGMYDIVGKFFYREMEAKRKAQSWKGEPLSKLWSWAMRLLCGYGERYGNVVVSALVIIFGLAVVYVYGGLNLAYAIYFSAVSFTALGYGSWVGTPIGWVQGVGAAESFLGVFMMALFLVTFIRKMTR